MGDRYQFFCVRQVLFRNVYARFGANTYRAGLGLFIFKNRWLGGLFTTEGFGSFGQNPPGPNFSLICRQTSGSLRLLQFCCRKQLSLHLDLGRIGGFVLGTFVAVGERIISQTRVEPATAYSTDSSLNDIVWIAPDNPSRNVLLDHTRSILRFPRGVRNVYMS